MTTVDEARTIIARLETELGRRRAEIQNRDDYYRGKQKLVFATDEFREIAADYYAGFADNWCAPVVEALTERWRPIGVRTKGAKEPDEQLREWWKVSGAATDWPLAANTCATTARVFALVWSSDADGTPEVTFEDPRQAIVEYEPGSRRRRRAALKLWHGDDTDFATLYTATEVWKFQRPHRTTVNSSLVLPVEVTKGLAEWQPRRDPDDAAWPLAHDLGKVPMVEIQNRPDLFSAPMSEIDGVIAMQDAMNAMWHFLFSSADFAAFPQRVILGAQLPKIPILNENGVKVGERVVDLDNAKVKRILAFEGPHAKLGQWDAADLTGFLEVIEKCANHIGNQTRTPLYYFASSIQNISGDTLKALETGLISKAGERQFSSDFSILEIHELMALVAGQRELAKSVVAGTTTWADSESRSEAQKVDALSKLKEIGLPLQYLVERYVGGDADEVARIMDMVRDQARYDPLAVLAAQERQLDRDSRRNQPDDGDQPPTDEGGEA